MLDLVYISQNQQLPHLCESWNEQKIFDCKIDPNGAFQKIVQVTVFSLSLQYAAIVPTHQAITNQFAPSTAFVVMETLKLTDKIANYCTIYQKMCSGHRFM